VGTPSGRLPQAGPARYSARAKWGLHAGPAGQSVMSNTGRKTCFISAPFGFDTEPLTRALAEKNVESFRLDNLEPGDDIVARVREEIKKSDLVCVVLAGGYSQGNVVFETGIALGADRPLLILAGPDVDVPFELQHLLHVRTPLGDVQVLRDLLKAYLPRLLKRATVKRSPRQPTPKALNRSDTDRVLHLLKEPHPLREASIAQALAIVFQKAGIRTSIPTADDRGADLVIWVDETQSIFGNPILVEVKVGELNQSSIDHAYHRLSQQLIRSNLLLGIIAYWDPRGRRHKVAATSLPLVACISIDDITDSLRLGRFAKTLLEIRNRAVHGVPA
jgi:hypothetical protein